MGMVPSLNLNVNIFQPVIPQMYNYRITIWRKTLPTGGTLNTGELGTSQFVWFKVVENYPAALIPLKGDVDFLPTGLTEKAEYMILLPYKRLIDGTLILQNKDVVFEPINQWNLLAIYADDSLHNHQQILGYLEFGPVDITLLEQQ